jgi:hypothetical protein
VQTSVDPGLTVLLKYDIAYFKCPTKYNFKLTVKLSKLFPKTYIIPLLTARYITAKHKY